jgi:nitrogen fixation protein
MGIREEVIYEGGPHIGDLIFNILLGLTLIFIPLTIGAIVRSIWLRYRITNRRISVTSGWLGRDQTDIIYGDIVDVIKVNRGLGFWGDMVLTMKDGSRLELRAIPKHRELYDYINEKVIAKTGKPLVSAS